MKKHYFFTLLAAMVLMAGCSMQPKNAPLPETTGQTEAVSHAISLTLPEGYWIPDGDATENECSIFCVGQRVGGVIKTDLSTDIFINHSFDIVHDYLGQYVPEGLEFDTMIDGGYPISADMVLVDPETNASREFMHYLYEQDGCCYDLWLDFAYLQYWEHTQILVTSGIAPDLEIIKPGSDYVPNFDNTGLNLGEPDGNTCPIIYEGEIIGGFDYTELAPVILHQDDRFLNMEKADPERGYPQMTVSEFRIRKYMQRHVPEGWNADFSFMYENQEYADKSVSVSLSLTNRENGEIRSYLHHFLMWDIGIFDSWNENTAASIPEGTN